MNPRGFNLTPFRALAIVLLPTLILFLPSLFNDWVNWDDEYYVLDNPLVQELSFQQIGKMFTTLEVQGNYHPLTLLSLAIDFQISGKEAFMYHLSNLLLHLLNTALVLTFIHRLTDKLVPALITALLFGIHPMHVESVAWISERKDVLYTFFFLGGLIFYLNYLQKDERKSLWIALTFFAFLFSLLSKGMAVTFPLILLLIDFLKARKDYRKLILEKIPFFIASLGFGMLTIIAQRASQALSHAPDISLLEALITAFNGISLYTLKAIIPLKLSSLHPYPMNAGEGLPLWMYLSAIFAVLLLYFSWRVMKRKRILLFGMGVYLISLAPVLQVLPVGNAMIAERYTYIAYIGLFLLFSFSIDAIQTKWKSDKKIYRRGINLFFFIYLICLMILTTLRIPVWENGETLWTDVIEKYPDYYFSYASRGMYRSQANMPEKAMIDFDAALRRNPGFAEAYINRGLLSAQAGNYEQARMDYDEAINLDSLNHLAFLNRGALLRVLNQPKEALSDLNRSIELNPGIVMSLHNRGLVHRQLSQFTDAIEDFSAALEIEDQNPALWYERAFVYAITGNYPLAEKDFTKAIELNPAYANAYLYRSLLYFDQGRKEEALKDAVEARNLGIQLDSAYWENLNSP